MGQKISSNHRAAQGTAASPVARLTKTLAFIVAIAALTAPARSQPATPTGLETRSGDRSVILRWTENTEADLKGYRVYRATNPAGPFIEPLPTTLRLNHYVDFSVANDTLYHYFVRAVNNADEMSGDSDAITADPRVLDRDEFLELVQHTAFDFFWYEANPANGLIRDRSTESSRSSIASVGFGLSAIAVAIDHGWITREAGRERVLNTLDFFWNSPHGPQTDATGYKGFYYHFLDMNTGRRAGTTELSTIDTSLLLGGVLHMREYFDQPDADEELIRNLSDSIYNRVDWQWAQVRPPRISHGWRPESGFIAFDWGGYNEAMIVYILALGSPTHPVGTNVWPAWIGTYKWQTHYGQTFVVFPPLFGHQYTHVWVDFRGIADPYLKARNSDYFENSRRATLAQRAYAIDNPNNYKDYGENVWGFTASDGPDRYEARGAPPAQNDDGTVTPTAPGGSYAFTPEESYQAMRHMYDTYRTRIWSKYGFRDAFNPRRDWFATDFIGIDQGPIVLMIENGRTGSVWNSVMQHEAIQLALDRALFTAIDTATEPTETPQASHIAGVYPNPGVGIAAVEFWTDRPGQITLDVYDLLGRRVTEVQREFVTAGRHTADVVLHGLPAGMYFLTLTDERSQSAHPLVVL